MDKIYQLDNDDFEILEDLDEVNSIYSDPWKIIVADDDSEVHRVTNLVLKNFKFQERGLNILSAYSEAQVKEQICQNPDTAVIFLDVIMDKDDSGLTIVKFIRDELKNRSVRIILRTGQPGQAPEEHTIENYDINDYKEKTELTSKKLFTSLITALRTYQHITELEHSKKGLEEIIVSTSEIFRHHAADGFYNILLQCLTSIVSAGRNNVAEVISGLVCVNDNSGFPIVSGDGEFSSKVGLQLSYVIPNDDYVSILSLRTNAGCYFFDKTVALCFKSELNPLVIVYIKSSHDFTHLEQNLLSIFYSNASVNLNNMELSHEIERTQKEILYTLGGIAEARSNELGRHVLRVAEFAKTIALGYGLSVEEAELIKQAAPMHDIGKIAIQDDILNKPGKLTPGEFEIMKTHTQLGYDLLKSSHRKTLKAAAIIALQHHEKYNGTGYPNKLKGEDIHIYGRIAAIADVFDALGCERVYKKAWELDKILELFRQERGQHFDPILVDILFDNLDNIINIKKSLPD
jgi:response regulator RpfG family c-di-GMP phosphodiesterase